MGDSSRERKKKNKARRKELEQRKVIAYRRRAGLKSDEEEVPLAGIIRRFLALAIDELVFAAFNLICLVLLVSVYPPDGGPNNDGTPPMALLLAPQILFGLIYFIPSLATRGQTMGYRRLKIVAIRQDGTGLLSWKQSFYRWFATFGISTLIVMVLSPISQEQNFVFTMYAIYLIMPLAVMAPALWTPLNQGIHDIAADSLVIQESPLIIATDQNERDKK